MDGLSFMRSRRARIAAGAVVAAVAIVGLAWHHHREATVGQAQPSNPAVNAPASTTPDPADLGDISAGQLVPPTVNVDASAVADARTVVTRFATNFGSPNGNRDDWLARITPDISAQLVEQYRLTDIRNVTQAAVSAVDGPVHQGPASVTFDVTYDDQSRIEIRMETGQQGWKAVDVLPLSSYGLPATSGEAIGQSPADAGPTSAEETP
ncbi:hypothetical protein AB0876_31960 [Mycobacterium sp. NPDC049093]